MARFLQPAPTPMSPLISGRSLDRRVATLAVPLDGMKRAAKATDSTLNDVFVAAVLGGLRRYHDARACDVDELRMMMPINIRGEAAGLGGNHFTTARLVVPLADGGSRRTGARGLGSVPAPAAPSRPSRCRANLATILNRLPRRVATALFGSMLKGTDFITSNVPGSPFPLFMCGSQVEAMYAFGPLSGAAANVVLLSHCGTCFVGVNTDLPRDPRHRRLPRRPPDRLRRGPRPRLRGGGRNPGRGSAPYSLGDGHRCGRPRRGGEPRSGAACSWASSVSEPSAWPPAHAIQGWLEDTVAPIIGHDPTGLLGLLPIGRFRIYTVTGSLPIAAGPTTASPCTAWSTSRSTSRTPTSPR